MASAEIRAAYVAISNTVIGVIMLLAGTIGVLADVLAVNYVVLGLGLGLGLGLVSLVAALNTLRLPEVSH